MSGHTPDLPVPVVTFRDGRVEPFTIARPGAGGVHLYRGAHAERINEWVPNSSIFRIQYVARELVPTAIAPPDAVCSCTDRRDQHDDRGRCMGSHLGAPCPCEIFDPPEVQT